MDIILNWSLVANVIVAIYLAVLIPATIAVVILLILRALNGASKKITDGYDFFVLLLSSIVIIGLYLIISGNLSSLYDDFRKLGILGD